MERKWLIATPLIFALLALCLCMGAIGVFTLRSIGPLGSVARSFQIRNTLAESEETQTFRVGEPAKLVIENPCGNVLVRGAGQGEIRVTIHKQAWGADQADAQGLLDGLQVKLTQEGDTLQIGVPDAHQACQDLVGLGQTPQVDLTITTPAQTEAQVSTENGAISVEALALAATLSTRFGDIQVRDLAAGLQATTQNGRIEADKVRAGSAQPIHLKTTFGDIRLGQASASGMEVNTENGKVELAQVDISGASVVKSIFGDLSWQGGQSQSLEIQTQNGKVTLENLRAADGVQVTTDFGDIQLNGVESGAYTLTTLNGKVEVNGAAGKVKAQSDFGDIRITNGAAVDFDLHSKNGQIEFQGTLGAGAQQASTDFGDIRVSVPADTAFDFDLQTKFGEISVGDAQQSQAQVNLQPPLDDQHWQGTVNGGGSAVTVASQNGNIQIELR